MSNESLEKATVLASLDETYTDSEDELQPRRDAADAGAKRKEPVIRETTTSPSGRPLVSYHANDGEEDTEDEADGSSSVRPESPVSFHRALQSLGPNTVVQLPPEPRDRCAPALQEKITRLYERKLRDRCDMNASIQMRKDFRNPSIYEKLVAYCEIDELGTNYPPEMFNPQQWGPESYYEELSRRQKEEMDKRDKKAKVDLFTVTAKKSRKSKWDISTPQPLLRFAGIAALSAKPVVISAFGALSKNSASSKR